jgi:uncharacterized membrane protein
METPMITDGFSYLAVLMSLSAFIVFTEQKTKAKFFEYLPAIVIIYFRVPYTDFKRQTTSNT